MEQQENELEQARREIDAVDAEMAALFCRRMDAVRRVAAYKQARGLPVLDAAREEAVVDKNLRPAAGRGLRLNITRISCATTWRFPARCSGACWAWGPWPIRAWRARSATLRSPGCSRIDGRRRSHVGGRVRRGGRRRRGLRRAAV